MSCPAHPSISHRPAQRSACFHPCLNRLASQAVEGHKFYQNEYRETLRRQQCPIQWGLIVTSPALFPLEIHALRRSPHAMAWQHASVFHYSSDVASWMSTLTQGMSMRTRRIPPALDTTSNSANISLMMSCNLAGSLLCFKHLLRRAYSIL